MDSQKLSPVEKIAELIAARRNFVLQGGAGSGKTESLKRVVQRVLDGNRSFRIACITHTNKAADEISDRIYADIKVSTIHSFLGEIISPFKRNIRDAFSGLFEVPRFVALGDDSYGGDEKVRKAEEHSRFKSAYGQIESRRRTVLDDLMPKVPGKREYDKDPDIYNSELNGSIESLNRAIREKVTSRKPTEFFYNDTAFDNFNDPSYGHDGLITLACRILDSCPLLAKILSDRFDCIFIDEYQDTKADVIRVLLRCLPETSKPIIGLFGDSEQAIYSDGIGSAQLYVDTEELVLVQKEDNYRCSPQVIEFANKFRTDGLRQDIALKILADGTTESRESREGSVKLFYDFAPVEVDTGDKAQDKKTKSTSVRQALDELVKKVGSKHHGYVHLKLTNKAIASDVGFGKLYQIFDDRYAEPRDRIRKTLDRLQFGEVADLIALHTSLPGDRRSYNRLIAKLRKRGFSITSVADKANLNEILSSFVSVDRAAYETIEFGIASGLIGISESHKTFLGRREQLLRRIADDPVSAEFEELYRSGHRTKLQMLKEIAVTPRASITPELLEVEFDDRANDRKQKEFYDALFSTELRFSEILAFYAYENDEGSFATMHKTKGTGIENVLLVVDEYGWTSEYDFMSCFTKERPESRRDVASRKILYVASSRTKKNLVCVRLMKNQAEADQVAAFFPEVCRVE